MFSPSLPLSLVAYLSIAFISAAPTPIPNPAHNSAQDLAYDIVTKPLNDPFYHAPPGYESHPPGTILAHRTPPASLAAFGILPIDLHSSHQIHYRTTSSTGSPSHSITTLLIPKNHNASRLVSYQDFEDSSFLDCSPSYALQQGSKHSTLLSQANFLYEAGLLQQGYMVSIPDYEGPDSAFGSGPQAGMATLDAIRAVLRSGEVTGVEMAGDGNGSEVDVVMWGYSGGSIPTEWAAEMQPSYAPELDGRIKGAAVGGAIADLNRTIYTITGTGSAGFAPAGIMGLYQGFKTEELTQLFEEQTFAENRSELFQAGKQCAVDNEVMYKDKDVGDYFRSGLGFLDIPMVKELIEKAGLMGQNTVPQMPLYFYKAVGDEIDPIESNDKLVRKYCDQGIKSLEYVRNSAASHVNEAFFGADGAVRFLNERFDSVRPVEGCKVLEVDNVMVNVKGLDRFGKIIVQSLVDLIEDSWIKKAWKKIKGWFGGGW